MARVLAHTSDGELTPVRGSSHQRWGAHTCHRELTPVRGSSLPLEHSTALVPFGNTKGAHSRLSPACPLCAVRALTSLFPIHDA